VGKFVGKNFSTGMLLTGEPLDVEILLLSQIFSVTVLRNEERPTLTWRSSSQRVSDLISAAD
jgi:hypothetical protein